MSRSSTSTLLRFCLSVLLVLGTLPPGLAIQPGPALGASAVGDLPRLPKGPHVPKGPPAWARIPSSPLVPVLMPSRTGGQMIPLAPPLRSTRGSGGKLFAPADQTCSSTTIDLKVLVIAADPTDTNTAVPAIKQALDYQGTPYTVFTASPRPTDPNANRLAPLLSSGCHGFYEGVILGNGQVAYSDPTAGWQSALTTPEWQSLWAYEQAFSIRQVTWYTYPSAEYGFNPPTASGDTTASPISAAYTAAGQSTFFYANTANPLTIQYVWAYRATPLDSNTTPLLSDSNGNALVAVRTYPNGTQNLAMTFDSNANVTHDLVLAYGVVNWVTNGLFLGERHIFMTPQVDDIFIDDHIWAEGSPCGTNTELNKFIYRMTGDDLQAVINWQGSKQAQPTTQTFRLDMVYVGEGTTGIYSPDTLTPKATANQALFKWVNHTFTHANLDNVSYNTAYSEITQNIQTAQQLGLTVFTRLNLVTPDVSGLANSNAMQAAYDAGVRYLVSDTSRPGYNNPSPNLGIYNQYQPSLLMIPRYPNNLFYNVTNPQQWLEEYNCIYRSFWGRDLTYPEILENESQVLLRYVLLGDMDPVMYHQTNLRAYDGTHTLLGDLIDRILAKYNALFALPILSPTMDDLGGRMASRMAYSSAGVTASIVPGQSITISSQQNAVVPVTGLNAAGAESYGGQPISHITLNAGQTITIPLADTPTATPAPSNTPMPSSTPTRTPTATNTPLPPTPTSTPMATNTPIPPSNTPTRTPTATNTPLPPTPTSTPMATNTPIPPSSTPTRTPTATKTPLPPTPTSTPTPANAKVTGGAQIVPADGTKANFGFIAQTQNGVVSGHFNYINHSTGLDLDGSVDAILNVNLTTHTLSFSGTTSDGCSFTVTVTDGPDKFSLTTSCGATPVQANQAGLTKGNIQWQPTQP